MTEKKSRVVKKCSVEAPDAKYVLDTYVKANMRVVDVFQNREAGATIVFMDKANQRYPVKFNQAGFLDLLTFGLEAIANNHE